MADRADCILRYDCDLSYHAELGRRLCALPASDPRHLQACAKCKGSGCVATDGDAEDCPVCDGLGFILSDTSNKRRIVFKASSELSDGESQCTYPTVDALCAAIREFAENYSHVEDAGESFAVELVAMTDAEFEALREP